MIDLMAKKHDVDSYHCVHFAVDVWRELTGEDLRGQFATLLATPDERATSPDLVGNFMPVSYPVSPCFVVMRRGNRQPHIGVFVDGKVLHMKETGPVAVAPTRLCIEYTDVRYYACVN